MDVDCGIDFNFIATEERKKKKNVCEGFNVFSVSKLIPQNSEN